jgi:alpha,alpha-trehalase
MRESGFDPSDRFGKFNVDIIHYDPVCLNSLLYVMESQTAEILRILDRTSDAATWEKRAQDRAARINALMWDDQAGLYFDYEFVHHRLRHYPFVTTFLSVVGRHRHQGSSSGGGAQSPDVREAGWT